jgi:hypothetical protein
VHLVRGVERATSGGKRVGWGLACGVMPSMDCHVGVMSCLLLPSVHQELCWVSLWVAPHESATRGAHISFPVYPCLCMSTTGLLVHAPTCRPLCCCWTLLAPFVKTPYPSGPLRTGTVTVTVVHRYPPTRTPPVAGRGRNFRQARLCVC